MSRSTSPVEEAVSDISLDDVVVSLLISNGPYLKSLTQALKIFADHFYMYFDETSFKIFPHILPEGKKVKGKNRPVKGYEVLFDHTIQNIQYKYNHSMPNIFIKFSISDIFSLVKTIDKQEQIYLSIDSSSPSALRYAPSISFSSSNVSTIFGEAVEFGTIPIPEKTTKVATISHTMNEKDMEKILKKIMITGKDNIVTFQVYEEGFIISSVVKNISTVFSLLPQGKDPTSLIVKIPITIEAIDGLKKLSIKAGTCVISYYDDETIIFSREMAGMSMVYWKCEKNSDSQK